MGIFGALIVLLNLVTFATTKERVRPDPKQKSSLSNDLKDVFTCGPWIVMFLLTLLVFTTLVVRGSSLNYLFTYYMDQASIRDLLGKIGLGAIGTGTAGFGKMALDSLGLLVRSDGSNAAAVGFSLFNVTGSLVQILGILVSKPLADRFGKKAVFLVGLTVTILATALIFFVPPTSVGFAFFCNILWSLGWGPTIPLLWVMIADVSDYSEWKNNRRATGFMFAGILFALKAGLSLGGALSAWILAAYGYVPNVVQSEHALLGIRLASSMYAAIPFMLALVCLAVYPITKQMNQQMESDLAERRAKYAEAAPA
jgi:Na+/melibiose symporter-like transporter